MPLKRVFEKMQSQISELAVSLENFTDPTVQPGVDECEQLQTLLCQLQESLAIYKFSRQDIEFSPSFMIHAKINEKQVPPEEQQPEAPRENKAAEKSKPAETVVQAPVAEVPAASPQTAPTTQKPLIFGLNDKFRFINELFGGNQSEFNIASQQLGNVGNWTEAEIYLNSLKNLYQWKENSEVTKQFYSQVRRRFE